MTLGQSDIVETQLVREVVFVEMELCYRMVSVCTLGCVTVRNYDVIKIVK